MNRSFVDVLMFELQGHRLAVELQLISSILAPEEAQGMQQLDLRPHLVATDVDSDGFDAPGGDLRVGLVELAGPPTVMLLGEVIGAEQLDVSNVIAIPDWIANWMSPVFVPACGIVDDRVVWLVDLDTLNATSPP